MFASAAYSAGPRAAAGAYRQVHVTTGVDDASPHRLVGMLFDGLVAALAEARGAMRAGNLELKGRAIGRAVRIVDEGLSAPLNLEKGGTMATDLRDLYITCATTGLSEAALAEQPHAGGLFHVRIPVAGLLPDRFAG